MLGFLGEFLYINFRFEVHFRAEWNISILQTGECCGSAAFLLGAGVSLCIPVRHMTPCAA